MKTGIWERRWWNTKLSEIKLLVQIFCLRLSVHKNWNVSERSSQAEYRWRSYIFSKVSHQILEKIIRYNWSFYIHTPTHSHTQCPDLFKHLTVVYIYFMTAHILKSVLYSKGEGCLVWCPWGFCFFKLVKFSFLVFQYLLLECLFK